MDFLLSIIAGLISGFVACLVFELLKTYCYNYKTKQLVESLKDNTKQVVDAFNQVFLNVETNKPDHVSITKFKKSYYKRDGFTHTYIALMSEVQSLYNKAEDIVKNPYITPKLQLQIQDQVIKGTTNIDYILKLFCSDSDTAQLSNGLVIPFTVRDENIDMYDLLKDYIKLLSSYVNN